MSQDSGKQQNTAYGVFVQACWAQHKRQYPDELIHKEIEEFNKQCSVWWYNLSEQERERFQVINTHKNNNLRLIDDFAKFKFPGIKPIVNIFIGNGRQI